MRVLFTNAGRRTYLVQFALELEQSGYPLSIHVSDCSRLSAAMHVAPTVGTHLLPPVLENQHAYLHALLELVRREGFEVIFPLSDLDPLILAQHREDFRRLGCLVIVSPPEVINRCNDKKQSFQFCRDAGLPTPESWFEPRINGSLPVIQKHIFGSGSSGLKRINHCEELMGFVPGRDMLQQLIDGDEFGLDILNDLNGHFVSVCAKQKLLMRAGETDKAQIVEHEQLLALGRQIAQVFGHVGNLDCDVLRDKEGNLYCIDFNPRFGGGYPTTHLAGFNYLRAILDMLRDQPVTLPTRPMPITVMKGVSLHWYLS